MSEPKQPEHFTISPKVVLFSLVWLLRCAREGGRLSRAGTPPHPPPLRSRLHHTKLPWCATAPAVRSAPRPHHHPQLGRRPLSVSPFRTTCSPPIAWGAGDRLGGNRPGPGGARVEAWPAQRRRIGPRIRLLRLHSGVKRRRIEVSTKSAGAVSDSTFPPRRGYADPGEVGVGRPPRTGAPGAVGPQG